MFCRSSSIEPRADQYISNSPLIWLFRSSQSGNLAGNERRCLTGYFEGAEIRVWLLLTRVLFNSERVVSFQIHNCCRTSSTWQPSSSGIVKLSHFIASSSRMSARLFLLAASAAVLVSAQAPRRSGPILGCTTDSFAIPSWFVQDLQYSSGPASSKSGNVSFHLLNRATNYTTELACQVESSSWNACSVVGKPSSNGTLHASVQVNGALAQVLVNETWTCNDRKGTHP